MHSDTEPPTGFTIEETAEGRNLIVTGAWSAAAADRLLTGKADGLTLNYARGYRERNLDFLREEWPVRRLELSHELIPFRDGGTDVVPRWPQDHAAVDPFRRPGY